MIFFRKLLGKLLTRKFYKGERSNWYLSKGYIGIDFQDEFSIFLEAQRQENSHFYNSFQDIKLERHLIPSLEGVIDSVIVRPKDKAENCIIMIQGRGEYYESRFRDMALLAKNTGCLIVGFNPPGMNQSDGIVNSIDDLAQASKLVVEYVLNLGYGQENIILLGNSIGAGIAEMVSDYFEKLNGQPIRKINSNSFSSLADVIIERYHMGYFKNFIIEILRYGNWHIKLSDDFYKINQYRCFLVRQGDKTLKGTARFAHIAQLDQDCPKEYRSKNEWLFKNSELIMSSSINETDPHIMSLHHFSLKASPEKSVFDFIKYYNLNSR